MITILTLPFKILKDPLDKIFDDIPGGSANFIPLTF